MNIGENGVLLLRVPDAHVNLWNWNRRMRAQKRGPNMDLPGTQKCEVKTLWVFFFFKFNGGKVLIAGKKEDVITAIILYISCQS